MPRSSSRKGQVATVQHIFETMATGGKNGFDRIRVEVSYDKGGWDGAPRGFSIMAFPTKVEEQGTSTIALFGGASKFVEPAARFSYAQLLKVCDMVRGGLLKDQVDMVLASVATKNGMTAVGDPIYLYLPNA